MSVTGYRADWPQPPGVRTWQTIRTGGVSTAAYASLNLGLHVGDRPELVRSNRERLRVDAHLPGEPVWLEQVHGTRVLDLDPDRALAAGGESDSGAVPDPERSGVPSRSQPSRADGAVTSRAGVVLCVMTADCLPVLLAQRNGRRIGVAHAGWRGLAGGVLPAAVAALDCDPVDVQVWLGPAITQPAFEVGAEVRAAFLDQDPEAADAFVENARGRWQADLYRLARRSLARAGVGSIHGHEDCTVANADRFFSHRRAAPCGRMATLIWREP